MPLQRKTRGATICSTFGVVTVDPPQIYSTFAISSQIVDDTIRGASAVVASDVLVVRPSALGIGCPRSMCFERARYARCVVFTASAHGAAAGELTAYMILLHMLPTL